MNCLYCDHPAEAHCPGRELHFGWKPTHDAHICKTRHCLMPLCCCVDLKLPVVVERKPPQPEVDPAVALAIDINPFRKTS